MTQNLHTMIVTPDAIPERFWGQMTELLNAHLHADFKPEDVVPYFRKRYDKFFILTDAAEQNAYGLVGMNVLTIRGQQFIYMGALVVHPDYRKYLPYTLYKRMLFQLMRYRLSAFWRRSQIYGGLVSPIPYMMMAKYISTVTPSPARPQIPLDLRPLLVEAIQRLYPSAQVDPEACLVTPDHDFEANVQLHQGTDNRFLDFYLERNPNYRKGVGLLFCVPLSFETFSSMLNSLRKAFATKRETQAIPEVTSLTTK